MDEAQRNVAICRLRLHKNYWAVLRNVRLSEVADALIMESIIEPEFVTFLHGMPSEEDRMNKLFEQIISTPASQMERTFNIFVDAIERNTDWLAYQIRGTEVGDQLRPFEEARNADGLRLRSPSQPSMNILNAPSARRMSVTTATQVTPSESINETEPDTIAYSGGILVFEYIRDYFRQLTTSNGSNSSPDQAAQVANQPGPSGWSPNQRTDQTANNEQTGITHFPRSESNLNILDAERQVANLNFSVLADGLNGQMRSDLGIGERRTELNIRDTAAGLRDLAALFETQNRKAIDKLVKKAMVNQVQTDPNWFVTLAKQVLEGGVTWGRIVSLFVFASRFAVRILRNLVTQGMYGVTQLARGIGTVVHGFAALVRTNAVSSWLGRVGGWRNLIESYQQVRAQVIQPLDSIEVYQAVQVVTLGILVISYGIATYWWSKGRF